MSSPIRVSHQEKELVAILQGLSEYDLTIRVLQPLFQSFGYEKVEYHGGPDEEGKDLICWKLNELADDELAVVQVKKYRSSKRASDTRSFSELVTQLSQAAEKEIPLVNGMLLRPAAIYLITPFPIDTKALKTRFERVRSLAFQNIKIIDGSRLASLVRKNLPEVTRQLYGPTFDLARTILPNLNNDVLMHALDARTGRDLRTLYTDLDIAMGKSSSRLILLGKLDPRTIKFSLAQNEWNKTVELRRHVAKVLSVDILDGRVRHIERNFIQSKKDAADAMVALREFDVKLKELSENIELVEAKIRQENDRLRSEDPEITEIEKEISRVRLQSAQDRSGAPVAADLQGKHAGEQGINERVKGYTKFSSLIPATAEEAQLHRELRSLERRLNLRTRSLKPLTNELSSLRRAKDRIYRARRKLSASIKEPRFNGRLSGRLLAEALEKRRKQLLRRVDDINTSTPTTEVLRSFLEESEKLFLTGASLLQRSVLREALGLGDLAESSVGAGVRLAIPINRVFDTGMNIMVLGDAGAGKTTSLQNYAATRLECARPNEFTLFAPLARVLDCWVREKGSLEEESDRRLETGLLVYLRQLGLQMEHHQLLRVLQEGSSVILLDAIDEVVKAFPWIIASIGKMSLMFPKSQIIASSRASARGIEELPFIALTLLPFTNTQREHFLRAWFSQHAEAAENILRHLHKRRELDEIVRNPLLATILCVLEENSVPLPDNELRLYEERMRLLVGDYDIHKGVRRIRCQRYFLRQAAQKLAFRLHCAVRRDATIEEIYQWTEKSLRGQLSAKECHRVVNELIDPCNILFTMTHDGRLGFGHLRYQEYLAALELLQNRSIDILEVARQQWWRGVMVLFSQMNQSIDWFLKDMAKGRTLGMVKDLALAMISVRPRDERPALKKFVTDRVVVEAKHFKEIDSFLLPEDDEQNQFYGKMEDDEESGDS